MDSIVVEPSSGLVGVSSMMQCANPEAHPGSILRSVNGILNDVTNVPAMTKRSINQKSTVVAELSTCNYILDNLPGKKWAAWRQESGEAFKRSLAERVEQVRAGIAGGDSVGANEESEMHNETETKASVLERSLRTIGIVGSIRVDEASAKGSVIDVIKLLCPRVNSHYGGQMLSRILERDDRAVSLASRISHIQINGKGHTTPVTDFNTLIEVLWMLPGRASSAFRRKAAHTICRVMGGDMELCNEIERNNSFWRSFYGGEHMQRALIEPVEYKEELPNRVRESSVRDALASLVGGETEARTLSGVIDDLSEAEVIEVKYYRQWKGGLGQVLAYGSHHPTLKKRLHLFAYEPDVNAQELVELVRSVCDLHAVEVSFEEVSVPEPVSLDDSDIETQADAPPPPKRRRIGPGIMELATTEQYQAYVASQVQQQLDQAQHQMTLQRLNNQASLAKVEVSLVMTFKEAYEQIGPLETRKQLEL